MRRRTFLQTAALSLLAPHARAAARKGPDLLGHRDFKYQVVPGWGILDSKTPVKNCHGIVEDAEGHIILLTDHASP